MAIVFKRYDLLVRPQSTISDESLKELLDNVLAKIEKQSNPVEEYYGYAYVFDARTGEVYFYYSDKAKNDFNLGRNKFVMVPADMLTKSNFLDFFKSILNKIKALILPRIVVERIKIKNGRINLSNQPLGNIINNQIEISTLNGIIITEPKEVSGKTIKVDNKYNEEEAQVCYLSDGNLL